MNFIKIYKINNTMKKVTLLIIAATFLANIAGAQDSQTDLRNKLQFGIKGGVNLSNVYDSKGESFNADAKLGFVGGGFIAVPIATLMGIQAEMLYSQKGFKATGIILGSNYDFTRTVSYIDIPIMFALKPSEFLTIMAGPQYSYLIKQNDVFATASTSIAQELEFKNDNVRKNTLCFLGGAEITLKHLVIGARAGWDLQQNNGDGSSITPRYKNVWYQATIGYRFY